MTKNKPVQTPVDETPIETAVEPTAQPVEVKPLNDAQQRDLIRLLKHHLEQMDNHEQGRLSHLLHTEPDSDNPSAIAQQSRRQVAINEREIASNTEIAANLYRQLVQSGLNDGELYTKMQRFGGVRPVPPEAWQKVRDHGKK